MWNFGGLFANRKSKLSSMPFLTYCKLVILDSLGIYFGQNLLIFVASIKSSLGGPLGSKKSIKSIKNKSQICYPIYFGHAWACPGIPNHTHQRV